MSSAYQFREATSDDAALLVEIEKDADRLLVESGALQGVDAADYSAEDVLAQLDGAWCLIAETEKEAAGFVLVQTVDDIAHVAELAVRKHHQGKGLGRTLMNKAIEKATGDGHYAISLSTFLDVPFNGPFYASMGFETVSPTGLGLEHAQRRVNEADAGLDITRRGFMVYYLNPVSRNEPAAG